MLQWLIDEQQSVVFNIIEKIVVSFIIFVVMTVLVKLLRAVIKKTILKNDKLSPRKAQTAGTVSISVCKYLLYFIMLCVILKYWGVDISSLLTIGGVATVAVGLGAQSIIQDMMTGAFILAEDQFGVGDIITAEGHTGTVESIGLRTTVLRSADGNTHIIPNGQIKIVTNMSKGFNRGVIEVSVAYEENLDHVFSVLQNEFNAIYKKGAIKGIISKPVILGVEDLADSGVVIKISADCEVGENWNVERELRRLVKNRFDKEGINIPYPHVTVTRNVEDK